MKTFGTVIKKVKGLQFLFEKLPLSSSLGRNALLHQPLSHNPAQLQAAFDTVEAMMVLLRNDADRKIIERIGIKLGQTNDIHGTVKALESRQILDDIQLFEVKKFALLADDIRELLLQTGFSAVEIPLLSKTINILDPQNQRIPHFYIYPEYDETLRALRQEYESLYTKLPEAAETIRLQCVEREDVVRQNLSKQLSAQHKALFKTLEAVAQLDIIIAKALLAKDFAFCKPIIGTTKTVFQQLFNPYVKDLLTQKNKSFQAIDIEFGNEPTLITGVNMGGKTVFLRSIQLAQYLFQFGFYVPAAEAVIVPVEDILTSLNDEGQAEASGLSSFAAEMAVVSDIVKAAKAKKNILALIDELARTTNPQEGNAIVNAVLDILSENHTRAFITTHYGNIRSYCRKLRVKGLIKEKMDGVQGVAGLNDCIDYALVEHREGDAPMAALTIARILKMDDDIILKAEQFIQSNKSHQ
ncbi:MAG: DNA mismatch repair protein MutS [Bacteroidales bacterium]|nr:DNA mismatch repair protein MutS [Bacteroidales bacterium]